MVGPAHLVVRPSVTAVTIDSAAAGKSGRVCSPSMASTGTVIGANSSLRGAVWVQARASESGTRLGVRAFMTSQAGLFRDPSTHSAGMSFMK